MVNQIARASRYALGSCLERVQRVHWQVQHLRTEDQLRRRKLPLRGKALQNIEIDHLCQRQHFEHFTGTG